MRIEKIALVITALTILMSLALITGVAVAWNYPELNPNASESIAVQINTVFNNGLDVTVQSVNPTDSALSAVKADSKLFADDTVWTPGKAEIVYITLTNKETVDVVCLASVKINGEVTAKNAAGEDVKLSDLLQFGVVNNVATFYENSADAIADLSASASVGSGLSGFGMVGAGDTTVIALVVYLPESAGEITGGDIDLGISLSAVSPIN